MGDFSWQIGETRLQIQKRFSKAQAMLVLHHGVNILRASWGCRHRGGMRERRIMGEENNRNGEQVKYSSGRRWKSRKIAFVAFLPMLFFKGHVSNSRVVPLCARNSLLCRFLQSIHTVKMLHADGMSRPFMFSSQMLYPKFIVVCLDDLR